MNQQTPPWWEREPPTWRDDLGIERPKYVLRFWFEWQTGTAFWPANAPAYEHFGVGEIQPEELPLSVETQRQVHTLAEWHDHSLNWEYPPDPGPWREDECVRFNTAARALYATAARELGAPFELIFAAGDIHEDPDLDAYLRDPKGFRRAARS